MTADSPSSFGAYAQYYDLLYEDKDYMSESRYLHEVVKTLGLQAGTVLELGCGSGGHALCLAALGHQVTGVDMSAGMLEAASLRLSGVDESVRDRVRFVHGDARSIRCGGKVDVVAALFHVMSYQITNQDLSAVFDTAAAHLSVGGLFLFDYWFGPAVLTDKPSVRVKRFQGDSIDVVRISEPRLHVRLNIVDVHFDVRITDRYTGVTEAVAETHRMRYLFEPELDDIAARAGFEPARSSAWLTNEPPSDKTWYAMAGYRRVAA